MLLATAFQMQGMDTPRYEISFVAPVWLWTGKGAWHFVSVPVEQAQALKQLDEVRNIAFNGRKRRGWGSIPVQVSVGASNWETSVFPNSSSSPQSGEYVLPLKSIVRKAENIAVGDNLQIRLSIAMP